MPDKQTNQDERKLLSRRTVLSRGAIAGALGVGAAMVGGTGVLKSALGQGASASALPVNLTASKHQSVSAGPVVIYIADPRSGEVEIFAGTSKTRHTDHTLAARAISLAPRG